MNDETRPLIEPLVGDLLLIYAFDLGDKYAFVIPPDLKKYNLTQADLRAMAIANCQAALHTLAIIKYGYVHEMTADDNMAACTILFPELWRHIEQKLGCKSAVAFPHRDRVLYTCADSPEGMEELRKVLAGVDFSDTHALSKLLFQPSSGGWTVWAS
jgi:uncharacterized protein YtpQ (UPF0354 family)